MTYLCSCLKTGQLVAVKALDKLHPEYERDAAIEEIRILAAVRCAALGWAGVVLGCAEAWRGAWLGQCGIVAIPRAAAGQMCFKVAR